MKKIIRTWLFSVIGCLSYSCSSYRYAEDGVFIQGHDVFISPPHELTIYVLDSLQPFDPKTKSGLKSSKGFRADQRTYKKLGMDKRYVEVLYSASTPEAHIMGLISPWEHPLPIAGYKLFDNGEGRFYYRVIPDHGEFIYHAVTNIKKQQLSLVLRAKHESFELFKNYVLNNSIQFAQNYLYVPSKTEIICDAPQEIGNLEINIPMEYVSKNSVGIAAGYLLHEDGTQTLSVFRILRPNQEYVVFKVCEGNYLIRYSSPRTHQILWSEQVQVKPLLYD